MKIYINQKYSTDEWHKNLYTGSIYLLNRLESAREIGDFAELCILEKWGIDTPRSATEIWTVEIFIEKTEALKNHFSQHDYLKKLVKKFVEELDEDPKNYYFDVPRIRVVPNYDYLHSGVCYAYKPHRDTWYGSPSCQINTWMPVFPITPSETMAIYPSYFSKRVKNTSSKFDLEHWITKERPSAVMQTRIENRVHPLPLETIAPESECLLAGSRGDMIIFSGRHLHGTVPNFSSQIRFSIDFRLYFKDHLKNNKGPDLLDDESTGKEFGFKDLISVSDNSLYDYN